MFGRQILYTPVVHMEDFDVAVSYLVRRLEENSAEQNFLYALFAPDVADNEGLTPLQKQEKDLSAVLTAAVIAMAAVLMLRLLEPVTELLRQLEQVGNLRSDALELLLKAAGIGLTAEVAGLVCADAGNAALAKMLRLLGTAAILCLSVPMFTALLECITEMVGYG